MKAYDFPWRDQHALEHRQFHAAIGRLQIQNATGEAAVSAQLLEHLKEWMSLHVLGTDRMYTEHLNARGLY